MFRNDLDDRLARFASSITELPEKLSLSKTGMQLRGKMIRSANSAVLNYRYAQGADSRKNFVSKLKVVLKELRKTNVNLKQVERLQLIKDFDQVSLLLKEADELVSIFVRSVQTATRNDALAKRMANMRNRK